MILSTTVARLTAVSVALLGVKVSLRVMGFDRTVRLLSAIPHCGIGAGIADPRWTLEVDRATRTVRASCLDRTVFLWALLRSHEICGVIRIGVQRDHDGHLIGHAWLEVDGVVVNDRPNVAREFVVFDQDPAGLVFG